MDKKIYILMATYNGEKYIKEQIESILNQTYNNWKLIIHDDASKDNTVKIIKEYVKKYPNKIVFIEDIIRTGGAKENFTYLLNKIDIEFDYIMFCDQDDVWLKDKIEKTLNKILEVEQNYANLPILVHTDLRIVDENLNILEESMVKYQKLNISNQNNILKLALENVITGCTVIINKHLYFLGKSIPSEAIMHDWWFGIVALKNGGKIDFLNESTILYRQHEQNDTGAKKIDYKYYLNKVLKFKEVFISYKRIYQQAKAAGIKINILILIMLKIYFILKKLK